jgi:serine/threonine protein phosphatase PrpC
VLLPFNLEGFWWAGIADGMGGRPGGDVASAAVVDTIHSAVTIQHCSDVEKLFSLARERIKEIERERPELSSMGTTLSLIRLSDKSAEVGHVGDSRIYHLRADGLVDRTVDQTEVEQLLQQGVLNKATARRYPRRNILLSVLSAAKDYDLYKSEFEIRDGDRLLLLTDGVSSKLLRREIRDLSLKQTDAKSFCDVLLSEIERRNPTDDYSCICIDIKARDD